jgi:hypothetical protein
MAEFCGGFSWNYASAEEPCVPLLDVIGIGIGDWSFGNGLARTLCLRERSYGKATHSQKNGTN